MDLGGHLKRLGKHSLIYGLGGLVSRILAVLLLPLYTRYLSPADYGVVETLIALTTVVGIALTRNSATVASRNCFETATNALVRRKHIQPCARSAQFRSACQLQRLLAGGSLK